MVRELRKHGGWALLVSLGAVLGAGCTRSADAPASGVGSPAMIGKVEAPAPAAAPDTAAQAMGGSGMPATGGAGATAAGAGGGKMLVDGAADTNAQAMGGSGMPVTTGK